MNVLIIGASGLIGGNIYDFLIRNTNWNILGTYNSYSNNAFIQFNASDINTWPSIIKDTKWNVIIHTGALTNVDECELNPELSEYQTVKSVFNLTDFVNQNGGKLIYLSTDYIFDGKSGPYVENDTTNPLNFYGMHKLKAEKVIIDKEIDYLILRVTNVYGNEIRNKNFVSRIISKIFARENIEIVVPYDQFATRINAKDIARASLKLICDNKNGVYHLASTDFMSRSQLLYKINDYFGCNIRIINVNTKEMQQKALRPLLGGLISARYLAEYPDFRFTSIDDFLQTFTPENREK